MARDNNITTPSLLADLLVDDSDGLDCILNNGTHPRLNRRVVETATSHPRVPASSQHNQGIATTSTVATLSSAAPINIDTPRHRNNTYSNTYHHGDKYCNNYINNLHELDTSSHNTTTTSSHGQRQAGCSTVNGNNDNLLNTPIRNNDDFYVKFLANQINNTAEDTTYHYPSGDQHSSRPVSGVNPPFHNSHTYACFSGNNTNNTLPTLSNHFNNTSPAQPQQVSSLWSPAREISANSNDGVGHSQNYNRPFMNSNITTDGSSIIASSMGNLGSNITTSPLNDSSFPSNQSSHFSSPTSRQHQYQPSREFNTSTNIKATLASNFNQTLTYPTTVSNPSQDNSIYLTTSNGDEHDTNNIRSRVSSFDCVSPSTSK